MSLKVQWNPEPSVLVLPVYSAAKLTAEKLARQKREREGGKSQKKKDEESSSDDEDYPPDPQQCQVSGKGFAVSLAHALASTLP